MTYRLHVQVHVQAQGRDYPGPLPLADIDSKGLVAHDVPPAVETWEQADELIEIIEDEVARLAAAARNSIISAVRASIGPRHEPIAALAERTGIISGPPALPGAALDDPDDERDSPVADDAGSSHTAAETAHPDDAAASDVPTWPEVAAATPTEGAPDAR